MTLATEPTYSTHAEFIANTPVSSQSTILEATWKRYALRAERIIDAYVNIPEEQKFDEAQQLKFPIKDENDASLLPQNITLAAIEITSDLILKGDPTAANGAFETSESWDGSGYSVNKIKKSNSSSEDLKIEMPPLARRLLMPWTNRTAQLKY